MILELDCGNSLIKWRVIFSSGSDVFAHGAAHTLEELFAELNEGVTGNVQRCRLVSVRSEGETDELILRLQEHLGFMPDVAVPEIERAGVRNGYEDHKALGLDRWMTILAAFDLSRRSCLVIDLGTAVTADYVDATGQHLGGFICPGLPLMRHQLATHTRRIRYDRGQALSALQHSGPGHNTAEAVERGCLLMLRSFVLEQVKQAHRYFPEGCDIFITGGDAQLLAGEVGEARVVHDLVFQGLSIACPIG